MFFGMSLVFMLDVITTFQITALLSCIIATDLEPSFIHLLVSKTASKRHQHNHLLINFVLCTHLPSPHSFTSHSQWPAEKQHHHHLQQQKSKLLSDWARILVNGCLFVWMIQAFDFFIYFFHNKGSSLTIICVYVSFYIYKTFLHVAFFSMMRIVIMPLSCHTFCFALL